VTLAAVLVLGPCLLMGITGMWLGRRELPGMVADVRAVVRRVLGDLARAVEARWRLRGKNLKESAQVY
jgi:hypothetical protein